MSEGFIYAFWHPLSPANKSGVKRIKIGRSKKYPWGDEHELRGEKLAFSYLMLGFPKQEDVFTPIKVPNIFSAEKALKDELEEFKAKECGRSNEAFDVPIEVFDALQKRTTI